MANAMPSLLASGAGLSDLTNAGLPTPGIYASETSAADLAYQQAISQLAQQQAQAFQNYGFMGSTDPTTGALQDVRIDPTQQYSQVMNLLNSHAANMKNLRDSLAGQGLAGGGGKGLAAQRAALLQFQQQGQTAGLGTQFTNVIGGLQQQQAGAANTRNTAYNQAAMDAINYAISNGWFNTPAPSGGGGGGGDTSSPAPAPVSAPGGTYQTGVSGGADTNLVNMGISNALSPNQPTQAQISSAFALPGQSNLQPATPQFASKVALNNRF